MNLAKSFIQIRYHYKALIAETQISRLFSSRNYLDGRQNMVHFEQVIKERGNQTLDDKLENYIPEVEYRHSSVEQEVLQSHRGKKYQPPPEQFAQYDKDRRRRAFKTIENKFFRPELEVNLLTWEAKLQIKHLLETNPEAWPLKRLADNFPISESGLQRMLNSRYFPRSPRDLLRHDRKVRLTWSNIRRAAHGKTKNIPERVQKLVSSKRLKNLENAAGIKSEGSVAMDTLVSEDQPVKPSKPGIFERIIADYFTEENAEKQRILEAELKEVETLIETNEKLLAEIVNSKVIRRLLNKPLYEREAIH